MTDHYVDVIKRLDMIVNELEGLPHVVATCREAVAALKTTRIALEEASKENTLWLLRMSEIRIASGLNAKPMLSELPDAIREKIAALEAQGK